MAPRRKNEDSALLSALRFVKEAQHDKGTPTETHCRIIGNVGIVGFNGVLAAGVPFTDDMPEICPHTFNLIHALERARGAISITVEDGRMTIKANKFTAVVPVIPMIDLPYVYPDNAEYPLNDDFRAAAINASIYTKEGAQTVVGASILTRNGSLIGSNGNVVVEAWHGTPTPPNLIIPKAFIDVIGKIKKKITSFGYTDTTFTIWFDDNSWIKTQLYIETWPNIDMVLGFTETASPEKLPKDFWEGLKTIAPFSEDNRIWFDENKMRSSQYENVGADYNVRGLPGNLCFNHKYLTPLEKITDNWDFKTHDRVAVFFGDRIRGAVSKSQT